jgi:hypothetical protein
VTLRGNDDSNLKSTRNVHNETYNTNVPMKRNTSTSVIEGLNDEGKL